MTNEQLIELLNNETDCHSLTVVCKYSECRAVSKTVTKMQSGGYKINHETMGLTIFTVE